MDFGTQTMKKGIWYEIEHERMRTQTVALRLESGQEESYSCDWSGGYGSLPAGDYRVVKSIDCEQGTCWIAAEFTIE